MEEMTKRDVVLSELADRLASPLDPVLTDGNLGTHVRVLVDAGFVGTQESWRGKRRTTLYQATSAGRAALDGHVRALNAIIGASGR